MADKRPLIFFSGGLDSTYLLRDRLMNHGNVDVIYADGCQSSIKSYAEKQARLKIIAEIEKEAPYRVIRQIELPIIEPHANGDRASSLVGARGIQLASTNYWPQPMAWFLSAIFAVDIDQHSCVEIGIVLGDQAGRSCDDLSAAWNHLLKATLPTRSDRPALMYPISGLTKESIIRQLPSQILSEVWVCETPKWENNEAIPCGMCRPCRTFALERAIIVEGDRPSNLQEHHMVFERFLSGAEPPKLADEIPPVDRKRKPRSAKPKKR